jgi:hypothetical protein
MIYRKLLEVKLNETHCQQISVTYDLKFAADHNRNFRFEENINLRKKSYFFVNIKEKCKNEFMYSYLCRYSSITVFKKDNKHKTKVENGQDGCAH